MAFDPSSLGLSVEPDKITRQLKSLWETEGNTKTRASLINFAVFSKGTDGLADTTSLLSKFVSTHSCRAILVGHVPSAPVAKISSWIQAHCHITKAGAKQVCSEQITLLAEGFSENGVANVLLSNLDYDLPLNLWWQSELPALPDSPLWPWVDRLVFDSAKWSNRSEQLHRLHQIKAHGNAHMALSDLNWTRTLAFRRSLAQCFDQPAILSDLGGISKVEVAHGKGFESTAQLLVCWVASRLQWTVVSHTAHSIEFHTPDQKTVSCSFVENEGAYPLSQITFISSTFQLTVQRAQDSDLLHSSLKTTASAPTIEGHFSAAPECIIALLSEEMNPSLRHCAYLKALSLQQTLF